MSIDKEVKEPSTYLYNINSVDGYNNIITVEHRSNNPKRDFLFVNKKQCKHIPCSPSEMLNMCDGLVKEIVKTLEADKVLVIGFAETATGIGYAVADMLPQCKYVMTTTRENIEGSRELITFEEEHSHATTQKLLFWDNLDNKVIEEFDYILFVEDEISTGNTILNFIKAFKNKFNKQFKFGVASICNWQNKENIDKFNDNNIETFALIRGELKSTDIKMNVSGDSILPDNTIVQDLFGIGEYKGISSETNGEEFKKNRLGHYSIWAYGSNYYDYEKLAKCIGSGKSVRVIGTEECMYPAIMIGEALEKAGYSVICHANTRSKIDVIDCDFDDGASGIKSRVKLHSAYDIDRETYLYNINIHTDNVLVVTDSINDEAVNLFMRDIVNMFGCSTDNIKLIRL